MLSDCGSGFKMSDFGLASVGPMNFLKELVTLDVRGARRLSSWVECGGYPAKGTWHPSSYNMEEVCA